VTEQGSGRHLVEELGSHDAGWRVGKRTGWRNSHSENIVKLVRPGESLPTELSLQASHSLPGSWLSRPLSSVWVLVSVQRCNGGQLLDMSRG